MNVYFIPESGNRKTGKIPTTYTDAMTCPDACPLKLKGCYAKTGYPALHWGRTPERGLPWSDFLAAVRNLPSGQLWRHAVAGDLPGVGNRLDIDGLRQLTDANEGRQGFTFTHKPLDAPGEADTVKQANANGFTVNLSANNLAHADQLADRQIGPVATLLPATISGKVDLFTPKGRRVVVCPATYSERQCADCGLCAQASRPTIVGFPAHGTTMNAANAIAGGPPLPPKKKQGSGIAGVKGTGGARDRKPVWSPADIRPW